MQKIRSVFLSWAFALLVLAPCFLSAKDVTLVEDDNGRAVSLAIEDSLHIDLKGNMTTGYVWTVVSQDVPGLQFLGYRYIPFLPVRRGSPGLFSFKFRAMASGSSEVKLVYARPWINEDPQAKEFKVLVTVGEK